MRNLLPKGNLNSLTTLKLQKIVKKLTTKSYQTYQANWLVTANET